MEISVFLLKKKDRRIHLVFNLRVLNDALEQDHFLSPIIDDAI